jgi:DNA-directed RNA polymerase alpha subunit
MQDSKPACAQLSTRQINALKNYFNQESFTPEEVARISYRQLLHISGVGGKSIDVIRAWLQQYGLDIAVPNTNAKKNLKRQHELEKAKQILNKYGYALLAPDEANSNSA